MASNVSEMQQGELAWWKAFLQRPNAKERLLAIYGYRYLPFFFEEFNHLGRVVDFGSGPISAALAAESYESLWCVDPLLEDYAKEGLVWGGPIHLLTPETLPSDAFDTALVFNVLDHTTDPQPILRDAARAIKPTGKVLVWVHIDQDADTLHRRVTRAGVIACLTEAGLVIQRQAIRHEYGMSAFMTVATRW